MNTQSLTSIKCLHCGEKTSRPVNSDFCCYGCSSVYKILNSSGLSNYYNILKNDPSATPTPVEVSKNDFSYMDDEQFINEFSEVSHDHVKVNFYLEGIHCLACLWVLEKLPAINNKIIESRLNMASAVLSLKIQKETPLSEIAQSISLLGYKPHPIAHYSDQQKLQREEERRLLYKIGVAGFSLANIMLYSVSIYGGATGAWANSFGVINLALVSPVIFYSATPFYQSAINAIRNKTFNIDIPIAFAVCFAFVMGIYQLVTGNPESYFDSISSLVFLLLSSRYLVKKMQQNALNHEGLSSLIQSVAVETLEGKKVHPKYLQVGDYIVIHPGETIPVDGKIVEGVSFLDRSLITGESLPEKTKINEEVFSGTRNMSSTLTIEVTKTQKESKLGKILEEIEEAWLKRPKIVNLTNSWAKYLYSIVSLVAIGTFIYTYNTLGLTYAFERALAVIIITCPCALGLATPLAMALTLKNSAKKGILIKDDETIEKVSHVKDIYFDKTGTLTKGKFSINDVEILRPTEPVEDLLFSMERSVNHPIALAITEYFQDSAKALELFELTEIPGRGVKATYREINYSISSLKSTSLADKKVGLYKEDELIAIITLSDSIRPESKSLIAKLKSFKITPYILSGDDSRIVNEVAKNLNIETHYAEGSLKPEEKVARLTKDKTLFVGDGANDSQALAKSYVGVAVKGSVDVSMRAASVYMTQAGLKNIIYLIQNAHQTMSTIKTNIVFSFVYNFIGLVLAVMGMIGPFSAAILMPISSFFVLLNTIYRLGIKKEES